MPATYVPHFRLSLLGTLPGPEIFSCNLSLVPDDGLEEATWFWFNDNIPGAHWTDIVADCTNFWARGNSHISNQAVLRRVKMAAIDEEGHYTGIPLEAAVNVPGARGADTLFPNQVARKVTLGTNADLGRVKGGFYLPGVVNFGWVPGDQLFAADITAQVQGSVETFLEDLNNAPGVDVQALHVVVASQGRYTYPEEGPRIQRVPPGNPRVERVSVGRRLDVQRRRSNKILENRAPWADVS